MNVRLFGCVCGHYHCRGASLGLAGDRISVPLPFYVIEHPDGVAVFDTGVCTDLADEMHPYRQALLKGGSDVTLAPDGALGPTLERLDIDPGRVRFAVVSHLHFDHAGGLHQLPNATLVVQKKEWETAFDPDLGKRYGFYRPFFDLGHEVQLVDGESDLFGDGSATCVPSFGHTPGHQSLRVRSEQGDHILTSDACYACEVVETRNFPAYSSPEAMNRSLDRLLSLREADTVMVFGHDRSQWGDEPVLPAGRA